MKQRFEEGLKSKKLNLETFPPVITNSIKAHEKALQTASKAGLANDTKRYLNVHIHPA